MGQNQSIFTDLEKQYMAALMITSYKFLTQIAYKLCQIGETSKYQVASGSSQLYSATQTVWGTHLISTVVN